MPYELMEIYQIIWLSTATASIAFTITETRLFLPFREWVMRKNSFLGKLVHCGYCSGHWIAFVLTAIYQPRLFNMYFIIDYFLSALVIAWLGAFQWVLMCYLIKITDK